MEHAFQTVMRDSEAVGNSGKLVGTILITGTLNRDEQNIWLCCHLKGT